MRMIEHFIELMANTSLLVKEADKLQATHEEVLAKYKQLVERSRQSAKNAGISIELWERAFFPVCAWIDEQILYSEWIEKEKWQHTQLQRIYFNTSNAGKEFFANLEKLDLEDGNSGIREVYVYCLSMGFKGMYFLPEDASALSDIRARQKELLAGENIEDISIEEVLLFPHAYESGSKKKRRRWYRVGVGTFILGASIVCASAFILLIVIYRNILERLVEGYMR